MKLVAIALLILPVFFIEATLTVLTITIYLWVIKSRGGDLLTEKLIHKL
jgi:hypothetical protein